MSRTDVSPKQRIADAFAQGARQNRALIMPFLVCGYPDRDAFVRIALAASDAGADMFEIGIPFSDPIMDGPVIAAASTSVLSRGQTTAEAMELVARAAEATGKPLVVMTYYNVIFHRSPARFADEVARAGACGVIVPDLSVEDSAEWRDACADAGIAPVFMAAQTSPPERLKKIAAASEGFVYAASLLGVTGVRDSLDDRARDLVSRIREAGDLPVAVGIGVSTPEHANTAASFAEGVIVGSAVVRLIDGRGDPATSVGEFVGALREATAR